jgi:hypothetical protein
VDREHVKGDLLALAGGSVEERPNQPTADAPSLMAGQQFDGQDEDLVIAVVDVQPADVDPVGGDDLHPGRPGWIPPLVARMVGASAGMRPRYAESRIHAMTSGADGSL